MHSPQLAAVAPTRRGPLDGPWMDADGYWTWWRKIDAWLRDNSRRGLSPGSANELARLVAVSQPTVSRWLAGKVRKAPGQVVAQVATMMGCSTEYLLDPTTPYPPDDPDTSWEVVSRLIPPEEKAALAPLLANARGRQALLAYLRALQGER